MASTDQLPTEPRSALDVAVPPPNPPPEDGVNLKVIGITVLIGVLCMAVGGGVVFAVLNSGGGDDDATTSTKAPSDTTSKDPLVTTSLHASTSTSSHATTTTTTTTLHPRTPGWTVETAVEELNLMYMGFNETDDSTPLGITMSYSGRATFAENIYCHGFVKGLKDDTSCNAGNRDCAMSCALVNHQVLVRDQDDGTVFVTALQRSIGYIFNQTLVETYFGKCSYLYDGNNFNSVNVGCGGPAHGAADCDDVNCAYYNTCTRDGGASYHTCGATDAEIVDHKCKCDPRDGICDTAYGTMDPPKYQRDQVCFYEMPALIVSRDDPGSFVPSNTNHLRDSMKQRIFNQQNNKQDWNEVVLDEKLLLPQISYDPTHTVVAFFYLRGGQGESVEVARRRAESMRDDFMASYHVPTNMRIPVVEIDANHDFVATGGPFKVPAGSSYVVEV